MLFSYDKSGLQGHLIVALLAMMLIMPAAQSQFRSQRDIILFDFENGNMEGWVLTGADFMAGNNPLHREVAQAWERGPVGFKDNFYIESGHDKGRHTNKNGGGTWKSPEFRINRDYLNFYLAGELHPGVRVFLEVDGVIVREAFGNNFYDLILRGWDVKELRNRTGRFGIEDRSQLRSLIRVDHIFLSATAAPEPSDWVKIPDRQRSSLVSPGEFFKIFDNSQITDGDWVTEHASIVQGPDDQWHLYAMVMEATNVWEPRKPAKIIHAVSTRLDAEWEYKGVVMTPDEKSGEQFLLHPYVMVHDGLFYMYYVGAGQLWSGWYEGPEGNANPWHLGASGDYGPNSIYLATSPDGTTWRRADTGNNRFPGRIFTEKPFGLTPFVTRIDNQWVMYYASSTNETVYSKHTIGYRTSSDLINWSHRKNALTDWSKDDATEASAMGQHLPASPWPEHSFFTNPWVIQRGDTWHLWAGPIDNANLSRYHCLRIFTSGNPYSFSGHAHAKDVNKRVFVDGGGRPFQDNQGNWYIFHTNNMAGGVWIAPLIWNDDH